MASTPTILESSGYLPVGIYCDMSTLCWITQRSVVRKPTGKQEFRAAAMTSHFRSKGMSRVFTRLPGDERPSCQTAT
jgi:hypothetical protein